MGKYRKNTEKNYFFWVEIHPMGGIDVIFFTRQELLTPKTFV